MADFDPLEYARSEIVPLLAILSALAANNHDSGQVRFFADIREGIDSAKHAEDLMSPFMQLATSAFQGFEFSFEARFVLDDLLQRAQLLSETLSIGSTGRH